MEIDLGMLILAAGRRAARARAEAEAGGSSISWAAVLFYTTAAAACFLAMFKEKQAQLRTYTPRVWKFWAVLGALLALLALARLLGLQEWLGNVARNVLKKEDSYEERRPAQLVAIIAVSFNGLLALAGVIWFARKSLRDYIIPISATVLLLTLVIVRMVSLHAVDHFFSDHSFMGLSWGAWFEGIPTLTIAACAALAIYRDYRPRMQAYETRVRIR